MSLTLRPYPEYKDSGLPWLGKFPKHWQVNRAKRVFIPIDIRSTTGDEELLTVSSNDGVVPRSQKKVTMFKAESYVGHKLCWPGDLVINSLWAWARGLGFTKNHGIVSSAYGVYRPRPQFTSTAAYLNYLLRSTLYDWEFHVRSKGIWVSRLQLTDESFFGMPIILPPAEEAAKAAAFLAVQERCIRKLIRAKRRVIELLNEQKQAIIHRAVTRGLNEKVNFQPTGTSWIGDIPAHWDLVRLRYIVPSVTVGIVIQPARLYVPSGVPCLRALNISSGSIKTDGVVFIGPESHQANLKSELHYDDIVVVRTGRAGVAVRIPSELEGANCIDLLVIRRSDKIRSAYLLDFLNSYAAQTEVQYMSVGAIQAHYNTTTLANMLVPLPPIREQANITKHLQHELSGLESTLESERTQINLLREYRTRLIADVVTGKLDVRGVELPEVKEDETTESLGEADDEDLAEANDAQEDETVEA